jgi:glycosyltransferase involved in cell wall biosynthesis
VITATLLDGLQSRGHDVVLLCRPRSEIHKRLSSRIKTLAVLGGFDANPVGVARTMMSMRHARTELLVTITPRDPRVAGVAARLLGIPVLLRQPISAGFRTRLRHRLYYRHVPAHYVANSNATRNAMLGSAPWLDPDRVSVVYNGIDVDRFADAAPADLGLPADAITVGFVGRLETAKGIREMMQAWPSIAERVPNAYLIVVGGGGDAESPFTAWAPRAERVRVLGPRRDMPAVMAAIDILAMPSHNEGFGLAAVEAMAAGAPVVAANAGALPELVDDNVEGRLVPVRDTAALADAVAMIANDRAIRESMGHAARARAKRDFDVSRMLDAYERLFERITSEPAAGRAKA